MTRLERLYVLWKDRTDSRRVVGELWRTSDGAFAFGYREDLPTREEGFLGLAEFPERRTVADPYKSRYLFSSFGERIPAPGRPDRSELLKAWGVLNADDPLEILARNGGLQLTDRFELAEYRADDDDLRSPLEFRIAATSKPRFAAAADDVRSGDRLTLRRESENAHDVCATLVLERGGAALGYVPRPYSRLVAGLLDAGVALRATAARRLALAPDMGRWVVRVERD